MADQSDVTRYAKLDGELESLLADLTPKQHRFCKEYFISLNATDAAERAGYQGTRNTLRSVGTENLSKPAIIGVMDLFFERQASDVEINAGVIEREYWKLYNVCINENDRSVARQCLKDLGEHHAMFIKVVAHAEAGELAARLGRGRERMNEVRAAEVAAMPASQGSDAIN